MVTEARIARTVDTAQRTPAPTVARRRATSPAVVAGLPSIR